MSDREGMQEEASVSKGRENVKSFNAFEETPSKAICRADRSTGKEKIKREEFEDVSRQAKLKVADQPVTKYGRGSKKWQELTDSVSYCIAKDMMWQRSKDLKHYLRVLI